jgi:putative membrane protein
MLFSWRGSILPAIAPQLILVIALSIAIALFEHQYPHIVPELPVAAFSLIGLALSIFLGFRNNVCYDRWWEARKEWGALIHQLRNLARESHLLPDATRQHLLYLGMAFAHSLNATLRDVAAAEHVARLHPLLSEAALARVAQHPNPPDLILQLMHQQLVQAFKQGLLSDLCYQHLSGRIAAMSAVHTACERIRKTPAPFAYSLLIHRTAYLYSLLLPIGLGATLGFLTPVVVGLLAYTFFGLDALGSELEEPFGLLANDLPLDAMVRTIEIDLRTSLGETDVPVPLLPVNFVLL